MRDNNSHMNKELSLHTGFRNGYITTRFILLCPFYYYSTTMPIMPINVFDPKHCPSFSTSSLTVFHLVSECPLNARRVMQMLHTRTHTHPRKPKHKQGAL